MRCTPLNASASEIDLACHWWMRLDRERRRLGKEEEGRGYADPVPHHTIYSCERDPVPPIVSVTLYALRFQAAR